MASSIPLAEKDGLERRELRVFVSSTFRDLQLEREELLSVGFRKAPAAISTSVTERPV